MLVSILIATFNRFKTTSLYLPGILDKIGNIEHEVLIWDNASKDGTFDWLLEQQKIYPNIKDILYSDKNIGMEAFNYLAKESRGKYILKVDDDITVPINFVDRLVEAFEFINDEKLAYLGWDMVWKDRTFATRSGLNVYKDWGKIVTFDQESSVYISYEPQKWMINGVCRLCLKDTFFKLGGHPEGALYGVDHFVSSQAKACGYWTGFFSPKDLVEHHGEDNAEYRRFKDIELRKMKAPKHV